MKGVLKSQYKNHAVHQLGQRDNAVVTVNENKRNRCSSPVRGQILEREFILKPGKEALTWLQETCRNISAEGQLARLAYAPEAFRGVEGLLPTSITSNADLTGRQSFKWPALLVTYFKSPSDVSQPSAWKLNGKPEQPEKSLLHPKIVEAAFPTFLASMKLRSLQDKVIASHWFIAQRLNALYKWADSHTPFRLHNTVAARLFLPKSI